MTQKSINPYNGELLKEYPTHSTEDVNKIITGCHQNFLEWRKWSFAQRAEKMKAAASILKSKKEELSKLISLEMGKPLSQSESEIDKCAMVCEYYAEKAAVFLANESLEAPKGYSYITYNPLGVVLAIMPWNFPFWQVFRFAAPGIMAGNTAILKHASNVPGCAMAIESIFHDAGFPDFTFKSLLISSKEVNSIIENDKVMAVTLTGSEKAGSKVAEAAGKNIKKSVLELGGSDPFIVLKDADLEQAIATAVKGRMINNGESCIAAKRFIVAEEIFDEFLMLFKEKFCSLKYGDPLHPDTDYGPLARPDLAEELFEQVSKSVNMGAKVAMGGDRPEKGSSRFDPTIILNAKKGMPAYDEELFGPVAVLFKFSSEEEAIQIANDTKFGLGAAVWTKNIDKAKAMAQKIESGTVVINKMMASHPANPFGGIKMSGYGRELAHLGIREFVNIKTVWM